MGFCDKLRSSIYDQQYPFRSWLGFWQHCVVGSSVYIFLSSRDQGNPIACSKPEFQANVGHFYRIDLSKILTLSFRSPLVLSGQVIRKWHGDVDQLRANLLISTTLRKRSHSKQSFKPRTDSRVLTLNVVIIITKKGFTYNPHGCERYNSSRFSVVAVKPSG